MRRAKCLAQGLSSLGVESGDRVATLCWNHHQHLEAYFGIPICGGVLHTLNLRLHPDELAYIVNEAEDRVLIVDASLLPLWQSFRDQVNVERVIVVDGDGPLDDGQLDYEALLSQFSPDDYRQVPLDERAAASMCYTSGTAGRSKGVVYSHRAIALHTLGASLTCACELWEHDTVLPVVPMFHVNAWGLPYAAAMMGCKMALPGPHVDPVSLLSAFESEGVTITAGVPTVWIGILEELERSPSQFDVSKLRKLLVGGSAVPRGLLETYEQRHGLCLVHVWGMTEMTPLGTCCQLRPHQHELTPDEQTAQRTRQGPPIPFVEIRARRDGEAVPWDSATMGELEVRGPWVAKGYYRRPDANDRFSEDGWLLTGDIVSIDEFGSVKGHLSRSRERSGRSPGRGCVPNAGNLPPAIQRPPPGPSPSSGPTSPVKRGRWHDSAA